MALRLRLWLLLALAGCLLVAASYLPPRTYEPPSWRYRGASGRLSNLGPMLRAAETELRRLEIRDSLLQLADWEEEAAAVPQLLLADNLSAEERELVIAWLGEPLRALEGYPFASLAGVAISVDSVKYRPGPRKWSLRKFTYFLPLATDGARCLAHAVLTRIPADWYSVDVEPRIARVIGPCAFYVAFGKPGPEVENWLEAVDYAPAMNPVWTTGGAPLKRYDAAETESLLDWYRVDLVACAAGSRDSCRRGLFESEYDVPWLRYDLLYRLPGVETARVFYRLRLGPNAERYLSDLLTEMGDERFARFWTSGLTLDSAFVDAFGVPIEDWTMRWARAQVGSPRRGPLVPVSSALQALLIAGVIVAGSALWATRRQVR